jgi:hypothetical protein
MDCRPGCGACCIAPSITTPLPGMPQGKPAGVPCPHLDADLRCGLWGRPERPACCGGLQASPEMCGASRSDALRFLQDLEALTRPVALASPARAQAAVTPGTEPRSAGG